MKKLKTAIRFAAVFGMITGYMIHMSLVWVIYRSRWRRVRQANAGLSFWVKVGLWILDIRVTTLGAEELSKVTNGLFVGNHLSYVDVLVVASKVPVCFVTSMEVKRSLGLGQICQMAGCLFVDRKNKTNLRNEVAELTQGLQNGLSVAIFPESTSTNGEQILRFRRPLYMSAVASGRPVVPFCLNYRLVGGQPIDKQSRDSVFWYGDMDFIPHLWALAGAGGVDVDLHFLPPMNVVDGDDPTQLAERSQSHVESVFCPVK